VQTHVSQHNRKQIVEIVRDAAGQTADGFDLLDNNSNCLTTGALFLDAFPSADVLKRTCTPTMAPVSSRIGMPQVARHSSAGGRDEFEFLVVGMPSARNAEHFPNAGLALGCIKTRMPSFHTVGEKQGNHS
jgi:hypothetical protein